MRVSKSHSGLQMDELVGDGYRKPLGKVGFKWTWKMGRCEINIGETEGIA